MTLVTERDQVDTTPRPDGQQTSYLVLSDEERAKGFVRPVRCTYRHVGKRPKYPTRDLTAEENRTYNTDNADPFVKFEEYPDGSPEGSRSLGRFWTEKDLASGCGNTTTMGQAIAETYARDPSFYGGTFCCSCGGHFSVGKDGEFVWVDSDGSKVGT